MTIQQVNLHGWPGRGDVSDFVGERQSPSAERFGERPGVVLVATAERGATPERWGLGIALGVSGPSVSGATLIVADDLDGGRHDALAAWARAATVRTPLGPLRVRIATRTAWCDPDGSGLIGTYRGGRWLVTADEGRSLGLLADWHAPATGRFRGGFSLGLPGWGGPGEWRTRRGRRRTGWIARLHEPPLRVKALGGHGLGALWGRAGRRGLTPDGQEAGHWEGRRGQRKPFGGRIVDLVGPAHAFDGLDTGDLGEHLGAFGLPPHDVPAAVAVDPASAAHLLDVARAVHQLVLALDEEGVCWLTSAEDQRDGIGRLGLRRIYSPGSVAAAVLRASGVTPPLGKFSTPDDDALGRWSAASHGGWCTSTLRGQVFPVADADVRQAYPAAWSLLGCWRALTARSLRQVDVTDKLLALCEQVATGDLTPLYDPATYRDLGLTLTELLPDGEPWPVERPGKRGPRFDVVPLRSSVPLPFAWPDVVLAAALSGRVPRITSATRLLPVGVEHDLRPVALRGGVVVPAGEDPVPALVRLRPPKGAGQERLRDCIRGVANPLAWGVSARLDQDRVGGKLVERTAAWSWPPIAATVPAVARMWLGMLDRQVRDLGGAVIARDTDGLAIVSAPEGGSVVLGGARTVRVLSWSEVDALLAPFDALDPFGDGGAFWSLDREHDGRPLNMLSLGPKRYVFGVERDGGGYLAVGGTEHSLGGGVVDPPAMGGRDADRRHVWTFPVAQRALDLPSDHAQDDWTSPWDAPGGVPFPVLRRFSASSPDALRDLPPSLVAHPFAPLAEAQPDKLVGDHGAPAALDPGDDLAGWANLDWWNGDGHSVGVGVKPGRGVDIELQALDGWALSWCEPLAEESPAVIEVDRRLIRRVGRGGALIDALLADPTAGPKAHQVVYDEGDPAAFIASLVQAMGRKPFASAFGVPLRTVAGIARGAHPDDATTQTVLGAIASGEVVSTPCPVDGLPVWRAGATYCSGRCRETAKARRRRGAGKATWPGPCALPGCIARVRDRSDTCSEAHKKELARLRAGGRMPPEVPPTGLLVVDGVLTWRPVIDPATGWNTAPVPDWTRVPRAVPATPMPGEDVFPDWEHSDEPPPAVEVFPRWWEGYAPSDVRSTDDGVDWDAMGVRW